MVDRSFVVPFVHRLRFTEGAFDPANPVLDELLVPDEGGASRVLIALDDGLAQAAPDLPGKVEAFIAARPGRLEPAGPMVLVPGGEICKNDRSVLDALLGAMHQARLCRRSYVLVIGGGAVLDVVGYAAAIFHRGVRLVRVCSTTLGQADSGMGVKNAVNFFGLKNLVGTFAAPWGVVNDERLLLTLSDEHWRGGFSEAVKVALLKDAAYYEEIRALAPRLKARDLAAAVPVIRRSATLHMEHITQGGDPFELRHARPLDLGHWAAHKLEQMTDFQLSHGHAVSIGLALDALYAEMSGMAGAGSAEQVAGCLSAIGLPVWHPMLAQTERLLAGLEEFREHLGGRLTITLVRSPGDPVDVHTIDFEKMGAAAKRLSELGAGRNGTVPHAAGNHAPPAPRSSRSAR